MNPELLAEESEKVAAWVEKLILKRIADDKLVLPSLPNVVVKCLEYLRQTDFSYKEIAVTLEKEPQMAARVLRLSASAAMGGSNKLNLAEAMARIGAKNLKNLLIEAAAQRVFMSKDPEVAQLARKTWEHSVVVATLSRDLTALTGSKLGDAAYLGGLLHDVGKPIVAAMLLETERQIVEIRNQKFIEGPVWQEVMGRTHRKVASALAEKWELPPEVARCIKDCNEYDNADRASIINAVCLSNALAKQNQFAAGPVDIDDVNALVMIGRSLLGIGDDMLKKIASDLKARVSGLFD
jgi:putative nucleotidyltransferase with HDIG domain